MSTILVADDELLLRRSVQRILVRAGYHVVLAGDGEEALQQFSQHRDQVDLVLLDLNMPKLCGIETLKAIKDIDPNTAVILTSGEAAQELALRCTGLDLDGMVSKPFSRQELVAKVQELLPSNEDEI